MNWERFATLEADFAPFTDGLKREVRRKQENRCAECGKRTNLQIHHEIPQVFGGKDEQINAIGLCENCHERYDLMVLEGGLTFSQKYLNEMPDERFKGDINPFKDLDIWKIKKSIRHDIMMLAAGKLKKEHYKKKKRKKKK